MTARVPRIRVACLKCGNGFLTTDNQLRIGKGRFCSRPCAYRHQRAEEAKPEQYRRRFWANVDTDGPTPAHCPELGPCHIWTGCTNEHGYGKFGLLGKVERAHRVAFFLAHGRWPEPCALHRCDTPACVRLAHLFEGTKADNSRDMTAKGRSGSHQHPGRLARGERHGSRTRPDRLPRGDRNGSRKHPESVPRGDAHYSRQHPERVVRGEKQGQSKLTEADVREIRSLRVDGELLRTLAERFGVTEALVSAVARRKIWRHVS